MKTSVILKYGFLIIATLKTWRQCFVKLTVSVPPTLNFILINAHPTARERIVGWYHTGPKLYRNDMKVHDLIRKYCPNPVSRNIISPYEETNGYHYFNLGLSFYINFMYFLGPGYCGCQAVRSEVAN